MKTVSVVISTRDEGHNLSHTVHAIINDLETFLSPDQFEIILVHNCSKDPASWRFLMERGVYYHRTIRTLFDPIAGNVTARNKGAKIATGKYLFFSDAHMSYRIGSFRAMIDEIDRSGGIVHPAVQWMGGYEPSGKSYQYTIKLGEKIWGTWNNYAVSLTEPFYIPVSGHCCLGMEREQFLDLGGYNDYFRCYGGGEVYLDMKWWMLGQQVSVVPAAVGYHLSAGRGYSFHQDDLIHNMMLLGYALGADAFAERVYLRYLNKEGVNRERLDRMRDDALHEAAHDRATLLPNLHMSFLEVLAVKPWDIANDVRHGRRASAMGIYDKTWTDQLTGEAAALFDASILQRDLREYIDTHLSKYVYGGAP